MKIIFFGTPEIAAIILERLLAESNLEVVAVVTKVDKPQGRSQKVLPSAVKEYVQRTHPNIPLLQPHKVSTPDWEEKLKSFHADVFVVVAYGEILKQPVLDIPSYGAINVHASLLPKYRGAAPMHRAIIEGEKETGVTIMEMTLALDAGAILDVEKISIDSEMTVGDLYYKMSDLGAIALIRTLKDLLNKKKNKKEQDHLLATYAAKITPEECKINWNGSTKKIIDKIRGVTPWPGAWCYLTIGAEKKRAKLIKVSPFYQSTGRPPGSVVVYDRSQLKIATNDGAVFIEKLQLEGKRPMEIKEFFNGAPSLVFE